MRITFNHGIDDATDETPTGSAIFCLIMSLGDPSDVL